MTEVDKVTKVVRVFTSSVSSAVVTIAAQNNVMLVSPSSTSSVFTEQATTSLIPHCWDVIILLILATRTADTNTGEEIRSKTGEVANAPETKITDPCEAMKLVHSGEEVNHQGTNK